MALLFIFLLKSFHFSSFLTNFLIVDFVYIAPRAHIGWIVLFCWIMEWKGSQVKSSLYGENYFHFHFYFVYIHCCYKFEPDRNQETRVFFSLGCHNLRLSILFGVDLWWLRSFYIVRCFLLFRELFFIAEWYITYSILELKAFYSFCEIYVFFLWRGSSYHSFNNVFKERFFG